MQSNPFLIPSDITVDPPQSDKVQVTNVGNDPIWVGHAASQAPDFRAVLGTRVELKRGDSVNVSGWTYIWTSLQGAYELEMNVEGGGPAKQQSQIIQTNSGPPQASFFGVAGETYIVNMASTTPILLSNKMTQFLGHLLLTTSHDKGPNSWPEESYPDGSALRKACTYIQTEIAKLHPDPTSPDQQPIRVMDGNVTFDVLHQVKAPDQSFYDNNPDIGFTADDFTSVMADLENEIIALSYLDGWYGHNGIMSFINLQMATVETADIGAVQNALEMQSDHPLTADATFSVIMGDLLDALSLVPGVGSQFATVMNIALSVGNALNGTKPNTRNEIDATVSSLYEEVIKTLAAFTSLNEQSYNWIKADYGRITSFQNAILNQVVTFSGIQETGQQPENYGETGDGRDFITAMQNGWQIWYFKQLYYLSHQNQPGIAYVSTDGFDQGWDPNNGKMTLNFRLPCTHRELGNKVVSDYLKFSMIPGASALANDMMFRTDMLAIDPLTFFLGVNGWRWTQPQYTNVFDQTPILTIG